MTQRTPTIRGVAEIVIRVNDLGLVQPFYEDTLGFEFISQHPTDNPGIVFLQVGRLESALGAGGHHQLLALVDRAIHQSGRPYEGVRQEHTSLDHVAFEIDAGDYEPWKERLAEAGVDIRSEVTFSGMNARALFVCDPEGNLVELICHESAG